MIKHTFGRTPSRAHQVPTSLIRQRHRKEVARWALATGQPADRDALAVIINDRDMAPDGTIQTSWTRTSVLEVMSWRASSWCATHRVPLPEAIDESLATYLRYLAHNKLLERSSDSIKSLLHEVEEIADVVSEMTLDDEPGGRQGNRPAAMTGNLVQLIPKKSSISARPS